MPVSICLLDLNIGFLFSDELVFLLIKDEEVDTLRAIQKNATPY
ncbi:MAG: hypothetical protein QXP56_06345 [Archaeoglobaceae archaeon]